MKRLFDIIVAAVGLVVLSPVLLVATLAILITDGWPVLFFHERIGKDRREFKLVKFRTMTVRIGAESGAFDVGSNVRATGLGRFLRRTKIDELPQIWNVLKGDMSIVGPRPEVRKWTMIYPERWALVHTVKPGITDPASIAFRNEEELLSAAPDPEAAYRDEILPRKLGFYERYVETRSFARDLGLIVRTVLAVIKS